jgi:hypothetical protein
LDPANATNPGSGIWGGLHLDFFNLIGQLNFGLAMNPVFYGLIESNMYSITMPGAAVAYLSGISAWGVG